jgi:hypothetical protein
MFGIDQQVQQTADAYRGKPQMLQQKYAQNQQLIDLLALQKLKSDKEEASRQMALSMQGKPQTIADQRESQVLDMTKKEVVDEQAGVMQHKMQQMQDAQKKVLQAAGAPQMLGQATPQPQEPPSAGLAGLPAPNIQGMAGGGIVAFDQGGQAGEEEARRAMAERPREEPRPAAPQAAPQGNMQAGLARLLGIDPEAIYQSRRSEAARDANLSAQETASKRALNAEREAFEMRNKLGEALTAGSGYVSGAAGLANIGRTAVNVDRNAMQRRHDLENQIIDMGPVSRMAGTKAGEAGYTHAMPGLASGVKAGVDLVQAGESAANRAESAATRAAIAATADERNRLSMAEAGFNKNKQQIFKQMADLRIEPGSPESIPYYNRVNEMGKTIYDKLQIPQFFVPEPAPIVPVVPPEKPGILQGLFGAGTRVNRPSNGTVDFSQLSSRTAKP